MLAVAAVLGERFDLAVLAEARGESETSVIETLRPAVSARLVNETDAGRYQFIHALVRSALEDALGPTRRLQLHRAAGSALEAVHAGHLDAHLPALAHHWARASASAADTTRAVEYATRAGDRALAQLAYDEAVSYYHQALELLDERPDDAWRLDLLISLGEAERRGGMAAYRQTLLDAANLAQAVGDNGALARAALANNRGGITSATVDHEVIATMEAAIEHVADASTRARLLANLAVEVTFVPDRDPMALSDQALALARSSGDDAALAHVLRTRYYTITRPETRDERWANTLELLQVAERLGDPAILLQAHYFRARSGMEMGEIEEFDRSLGVAERLANELGQPTLRWVNTWQRIGRVILAGDFAEAECLSQEAIELGQSSGQKDAGVYFNLQRFAICFERGRLDEIAQSYSAFADEHPHLTFLEAMLALLHTELGQEEEAQGIIDRLASSGFEGLPRDLTRIRAMTSLAAAASHLRAIGPAEVLYGMLAPHQDQIDTMAGIVCGGVAHYLGLLAATVRHFDDAEAHYVTAEAIHRRIGAPCWLARTRLEWARMLLARAEPKDGDRADEFLHQALATARELGLAKIEREAVGLLA
jgi:tetratricopeptide (TPR) repeat protein